MQLTPPSHPRRRECRTLEYREQRARREAASHGGVAGLPGPHAGGLTLAMASTLAGNLTITGSVANIIVVQRAAAERVHIGFREYFRVGVPVTIVTLAVGSI